MRNLSTSIGLWALALYSGFGSHLAAQETDKQAEKALRESRNLTWEANKALSENAFTAAEADYRKAISKSDKNAAAPYNLGNAYYNKETYAEAFGRYKEAGEKADNKSEKHQAYHNMGNVFMKRKEYEKAVEAYKESLRNDPTDEETRYNLALAQEMLKKQEDENQNDQDQQDQDQNQDQDQDKDEQDENQGDNQDQGDQGDEGDEDKNEGGDGDQEQENDPKDEGDPQEDNPQQPDEQEGEGQQPPQPRQGELSPQQIQNLLEAMQNEERKVQEKIDAQKVQGAPTRNEKDW